MNIIIAYTLGLVTGLLAMLIIKRKTIININTVPTLGIEIGRGK